MRNSVDHRAVADLLDQGLGSSAIAERLNCSSRTVRRIAAKLRTGQLSRAHPPARRSRGRQKGGQGAGPRRGGPSGTRNQGPRGKVLLDYLDSRDDMQGEGKDLLDLRPRDCRWPYKLSREGDYRFCGRAADEGRSYCPEHVARAYLPD